MTATLDAWLPHNTSVKSTALSLVRVMSKLILWDECTLHLAILSTLTLSVKSYRNPNIRHKIVPLTYKAAILTEIEGLFYIRVKCSHSSSLLTATTYLELQLRNSGSSILSNSTYFLMPTSSVRNATEYLGLWRIDERKRNHQVAVFQPNLSHAS